MQVTKAILPAYTALTAKWNNCKGCALADRVIHAEGQMPADIFFLAKAPDEGATALGRPYPRKDDLFYKVVSETKQTWVVAYAMSCGYDKEVDAKTAMTACWPKVLEMLAMAKPKLLVCMGQIVHGFVITKANTIVPRPPIIAIPDTDYIGRQDDHLAALIKAQLKVRDAVVKYL